MSQLQVKKYANICDFNLEKTKLINYVSIYFKKNPLFSNKIHCVILIKDKSSPHNELTKSIIHLLSSNSYFEVSFADESYIVAEEGHLIEAISISNYLILHFNNDSCNLDCQDSFLSLILEDLKLISTGKIYSPVSEISFQTINLVT
jgi:hypothetical protein